MADQVVGVSNQTAGAGVLLVDVVELTVNTKTVERQRVSLASGTADGNYLTVTAAGAAKVDGSATTQPVSRAASATGTLTQVAGSATAVTVLASNASRLGCTIVNDSTSILYLGLSVTTPTISVYSYKLPAGSTFEMNPSVVYSGVIKGIWASANGNAVVTEFT